ncbi:YdeI/OmpD-associated family protein [Arthrobacter sp. LAPM80]|uniref:YdeI/OmpD-associated family protein n=1 Tax=Arthrobacter sp. LAPM80 TaxID=3141788 RepID=UPI00398B5E61
MADCPELLVPDAPAWRAWLEENHASSPGVLLVLHKKGGNVTELAYAAALDEALGFGWIDGVVGKRDADTYLQRFTPRTRTSKWSKINTGHYERLLAEGLMRAAGTAAADAAKADGRWEIAYSGQGTAEVPDDLADAIAASPRAQAMFEVLTAVNRYSLIYRTNSVKTPSVRAAKIAGFVRMLEAGQAPYPQKRRP